MEFIRDNFEPMRKRIQLIADSPIKQTACICTVQPVSYIVFCRIINFFIVVSY